MTKDIIDSSRIKLIPFGKEQLTEDYLSWLNDKETMRYSDQRFKNHSMESCREYWKSFNDSPNEFWAIIYKNEGHNKHVGNLTITIDPIHLDADISILIGNRNVWGKGLGLEAWNAMIKYLFEKKQIEKVTAGTLITNKAMLKIMQKSKMLDDGIKRKHCIFEGRRVDMVYVALFRDKHRK